MGGFITSGIGGGSNAPQFLLIGLSVGAAIVDVDFIEPFTAEFVYRQNMTAEWG